MKTKKSYIRRISIFGLLILGFYIVSCNTEKETSSEKIKSKDEPVKQIAQEQNSNEVIELEGQIGQAKRWSSDWVDLNKAMDFHNGDSLIVIVGGTADRIVLRLLSEGKDPNSPNGVVGRIHQVNANGEVHDGLSRDFHNVIQISVHGGENPWGVYPLGTGNGAAFIQKVTLIR